MNVNDVLSKRQVMITCGTGGVGKTTVSAALAITAATAGRKVLVITIDPAKRLATSLGLQSLGHEPTDLTPRLRSAAGACSGELWATIPDTRRTFEDFIRSIAPTAKLRERIFSNPIFQVLGKEFSGANEYMAIQKLEELTCAGWYDLIVLDTPPSRSTVDFIDAPRVISRFFDEHFLRWLVVPTTRLLSKGMQGAFGILEQLTGESFTHYLFEFFSIVFEVQKPFLQRLKRLSDLLASERVGFLMVAVPAREAIPELERLVFEIKNRGLKLDGMIVNRTLGHLTITDEERALAAEQLVRGKPELAQSFEILESLRESETKVMRSLREIVNVSGRERFFLTLPELRRDVHSMTDLVELTRFLHHSDARE